MARLAYTLPNTVFERTLHILHLLLCTIRTSFFLLRARSRLRAHRLDCVLHGLHARLERGELGLKLPDCVVQLGIKHSSRHVGLEVFDRSSVLARGFAALVHGLDEEPELLVGLGKRVKWNRVGSTNLVADALPVFDLNTKTRSAG